MSSEYDTLYSFLEKLIIQNKQSNQNQIVTPISISAVFPSPPNAPIPSVSTAPLIVSPLIPSTLIPSTLIPSTPVKRGRGRPAGSKTKPRQKCQACFRSFPFDIFEKHHKRSKICKKFYELEKRPPVLEKPIHQLIIDALEKATSTEDRCRFCEEKIEDMKKHMTESQLCNRLAYATFKTIF